MREKEVEQALVRSVRKAGGLCMKFTCPVFCPVLLSGIVSGFRPAAGSAESGSGSVYRNDELKGDS